MSREDVNYNAELKRLYREEWSFFRALALLFLILAVIDFFTMSKFYGFNLLCAVVFDMKHDVEKLKRSEYD